MANKEQLMQALANASAAADAGNEEAAGQARQLAQMISDMDSDLPPAVDTPMALAPGGGPSAASGGGMRTPTEQEGGRGNILDHILGEVNVIRFRFLS